MEYAIGDIQGCYEALMRLLTKLNFADHEDRLWLVGDLVNRGPDSLKVLRFIKSLSLPPYITLGNHDLHLLHRIFLPQNSRLSAEKDSLDLVVNAADAEDLGHWLRKQKILHHDPKQSLVMCHAGIPPIWDLDVAKKHAQELEATLRGPQFLDFLSNLYGNLPNQWSNTLSGVSRLRLITNYFTRMRFCNADGSLNLDYKGDILNAPANLQPWFLVANRKPIKEDIIFGHWAALQGIALVPGIYPLDTGYVWGGQLTALRLSDRKKITVSH